MESSPQFAVEQEQVDDLKKNRASESVPDDVIEDAIAELSGEKAARQGGYTYFKPLVAANFEEGHKLTKYECEDLLKYSSFPNKKIVMREIRAGRAWATVKNRRLTIEHE